VRCTFAIADLAASEVAIEENQLLGPDPSLPHARDARGRFAKGSSGNPRGRPPGIPNPKRRVPDLVARPISAQALSDLLDRKPHLLRPLAAQLLPPPLPAYDPAECFRIGLSPVRTVEDLWRVQATVLNALARGELPPAAAARIARRVCARLSTLSRLKRLGARVARVYPAVSRRR
jgi:Family of unknown function (DUF5681)